MTGDASTGTVGGPATGTESPATGRAEGSGAGRAEGSGTRTAKAGDRRPRRWHRAAVPFAVVAALILGTVVMYLVEQPDPTDPAFLSPVSTAGIGGSQLAARVRDSDVEVRRETDTRAALRATAQGLPATLLIPAPELLRRSNLRMLALLPTGTRVVLVDPRPAALHGARIPVSTGSRRLAAAVRAPGACELDEAVTAGPAAVTRQRYGDVAADVQTRARCYDDGLLVLRWHGVELILIGASDPFRNDRIAEHGNAALATGLLATRSRLIWLDLHRLDPVPPPGDSPVGDPDLPGNGEGDRGGDQDGNQDEGGGGRERADDPPDDQADGDSDAGNPLFAAFPAWFWAALVLVVLAAVLFTLWRGRRLGPPVAEPLPVTIRSAETVRGRGRLYQRAHARGPALEILRAAARPRLSALLGLPPDTPAGTLIDAVAAQSGRQPAEVEELLYGPPPADDDDLVRMAGGLDALTRAMTAPPPGHREERQ